MRSVGLAAAALVALAAGAVGGYLVGGGDAQTTTVTATVTRTATAVSNAGLPRAVADKHRQLLEAAESGDYEALRPLIDPDVFEYTFGSPVRGGPVAYWKQLQRTTPERPIETLAAILKMPYTLHRGIYVWPFVFDKNPRDLTAHEVRLLAPIATPAEVRQWRRFDAYYGWRAGLTPDGDWQFFIAGD